MYMCHNPRWDPRAPEITEDIYVYIYMYMCHTPRWDPWVP